MINHRLILIVFISFAQVCVAQTTDLPRFEKHESYSGIRIKMLKLGWKPHHAKDADTCLEGDTHCVGRPEMEACAGTGLGNCRFLWKKRGQTVAICTVGDEASYDGICN